MAVVLRTIGSVTSISPYIWTSTGGDVTNSNPHIPFDPARNSTHTFLYAWKSGRVYASIDGSPVWDQTLETLSDWTTDGQHWLGAGYNQMYKLTARMGDVRIYDYFRTVDP